MGDSMTLPSLSLSRPRAAFRIDYIKGGEAVSEEAEELHHLPLTLTHSLGFPDKAHPQLSLGSLKSNQGASD